MDDLSREELLRIVSSLMAWTQVYGAALVPTGPDTYGEGVRACKAQVRTLIKSGLREVASGRTDDPVR